MMVTEKKIQLSIRPWMNRNSNRFAKFWFWLYFLPCVSPCIKRNNWKVMNVLPDKACGQDPRMDIVRLHHQILHQACTMQPTVHLPRTTLNICLVVSIKIPEDTTYNSRHPSWQQKIHHLYQRYRRYGPGGQDPRNALPFTAFHNYHNWDFYGFPIISHNISHNYLQLCS
jgi:hypothetical protein